MSGIVVVGCGRIGMPLALAFASRGAVVLCVDTDERRLSELSGGIIDPDDEGLSEGLRAAIAGEVIRFGPLRPSAEARAFIICVPTPVDDDRRFVREPLDRALAAVTAVARDDDLIVIRSTVPIGTTRSIAQAAPKALRWAACPDRSSAGRALADQFEIPHVIGGLDEVSAAAADQLFSALGPTRRVSSPEAAEALKLLANVHRDMNFALANQFALICEGTGVDFSEVRSAGADGFPRFSLARAGPVGGPCLTKDVFLLGDALRQAGVSIDLLLAGRALNESLANRFAAIVQQDLQALGGGSVAILGLAFKGDPPVLDRAGGFASALEGKLRQAGVSLSTWDPVSDPPQARVATLKGARVVVLANDHPDLADLSDIERYAPDCIVRDLSGVADPATAHGVDLRVFGKAGAHDKPLTSD